MWYNNITMELELFGITLLLKHWILIFYGIYLLLISFIAFCLYHSDKKKAEKGKWRIPEKVLLGIALLGGAFGSYLAMLIFRHKTKREHWYFTFCNLLGILIHTTIFLLIVFLWRI